MRLVEVAAQFREVVQSECTLMYFGIDAKWAREDWMVGGARDDSIRARKGFFSIGMQGNTS